MAESELKSPRLVAGIAVARARHARNILCNPGIYPALFTDYHSYPYYYYAIGIYPAPGEASPSAVSPAAIAPATAPIATDAASAPGRQSRQDCDHVDDSRR